VRCGGLGHRADLSDTAHPPQCLTRALDAVRGLDETTNAVVVFVGVGGKRNGVGLREIVKALGARRSTATDTVIVVDPDASSRRAVKGMFQGASSEIVEFGCTLSDALGEAPAAASGRLGAPGPSPRAFAALLASVKQWDPASLDPYTRQWKDCFERQYARLMDRVVAVPEARSQGRRRCRDQAAAAPALVAAEQGGGGSAASAAAAAGGAT